MGPLTTRLPAAAAFCVVMLYAFFFEMASAFLLDGSGNGNGADAGEGRSGGQPPLTDEAMAIVRRELQRAGMSPELARVGAAAVGQGEGGVGVQLTAAQFAAGSVANSQIAAVEEIVQLERDAAVAEKTAATAFTAMEMWAEVSFQWKNPDFLLQNPDLRFQEY